MLRKLALLATFEGPLALSVCRLHVVGETLIDVNHCLLAMPGVSKEDLIRVISHPQVVLRFFPLFRNLAF